MVGGASSMTDDAQTGLIDGWDETWGEIWRERMNRRRAEGKGWAIWGRRRLMDNANFRRTNFKFEIKERRNILHA